MRNFPVSPTRVLGHELPDNWGGLKSADIGFLNGIIRSLYHTHAAGGGELQNLAGRFVSSNFDVLAGGGPVTPNNWVQVSGPAELAVVGGQPTVAIPAGKSALIVANAFVEFLASGGANSVALQDRLYTWLSIGNQQPSYRDVARLLGGGGVPEVTMKESGAIVGSGIFPVNVTFLPVIDNAGAEKTVRRGTSLEITALYVA